MDKELSSIHPGEILLEDFLKPMELSAYKLAKELKENKRFISFQQAS
ncbi:helix-turn-helix transcriptional regulator [Leptospira sp. 'Mane']